LAVAALSSGRIVAVKGIGGFHLMVDAASSEAVSRLRARKHREEKPFALMFPTLDAARHACEVEDDEARLLLSAEAPIVLLRRRAEARVGLADEVAPGNPYLGIMLPYSPLHHLLVGDLGRPVVATSGNLSDEPICIDEYEALDRLGGIADAFLVHNRPIVRHVDDSIVRLMLGRELVVRRARGYAPLPVHLRMPVPPMLAVGGHYKNTVVAAAGTEAFISQHVGDLETETSAAAFHAVLGSVQSLYQITPAVVVADRHPGYVSTRYAQALGVPVIQVQHHHAHVASCMAENDLDGPVLGVSWDGTGYGDDGTVWGGEFLRVEGGAAVRVGAFRTFRLPGGEAAIREPRRSALGALYALYGEAAGALDNVTTAFDPAERRLLLQALARGVNSPITSSAGRLFDAVAALSGIRARASYEGQAAFELECQVDETCGDAYPVVLDTVATPFVLDWGPALRAVLDDAAANVSRGVIAARFHNMLAAAIVAAARQVGEPRVVLTGGCFQNRVLTERAVTGLRAAGFRPYWHQRVPPNDGGLALGQVAAAALSHAATGPMVTQQVSEPARARVGQQAPAMT
jgi:hydrogenase maturation protein HypF